MNPSASLEKKIDVVARVGYAARAIVYGLMGIFALLIAFGYKGGKLTDTQGSLRHLLAQPFGMVFLMALGIGLFSYALWRFLQAVFDYDDLGTETSGLFLRTANFIGALAHVALGYYAINLIFHLSAEDGGDHEKQMAHWLLTQPFGTWLTGVFALTVIGFGIAQVYIAFREKFLRHLHLPADKKPWLCRVCKFGLIARGIVFCTVGWLFMRAALHSNSSEAKGVKGAWQFLAEQPFGITLVALVAVGLIAFAVYGLTEALYRKTT